MNLSRHPIEVIILILAWAFCSFWVALVITLLIVGLMEG